MSERSNSKRGTVHVGSNRSLLDGATSYAPIIAPELESQRSVAADPARPLEERLEAFEDIYDSEVGDTTLTRARNIEREVGLRQLYLKFDGGNPTGTQKDRIAFAQAMDALRRGYDTMSVASCGNYGAAMALAADLAGLRCIIHIPARYHTRRIAEMREHHAKIVRVPGDYEKAVAVSQAHAERDELYDANPGGANTPLQFQAYGEIAFEVYDDLRDAPAAVAIPVSNGTTLAGIVLHARTPTVCQTFWRGFEHVSLFAETQLAKTVSAESTKASLGSTAEERPRASRGSWRARRTGRTRSYSHI